jgi:uncharacterized RDD family membrane protein YckC
MLALTIDVGMIAVFATVLRQALAPLKLFGEDIETAVNVVGYFALTLAYGAVSEWLWRGQTVGKHLFGLRVVDARGLRLEPAQVIVRNLMRSIDALPLLYLVGGAACYFHRHHRRLGDIAAGTVVIRTAKLAEPDLDRITGGKYNSLRESRHLAARLRQKVSPEVARVALETLIRRDKLDPVSRLAIFSQLARHLQALVPYPAEITDQLSDEQYVRNVTEIVFGRPAAAPPGQAFTPSDPVR